MPVDRAQHSIAHQMRRHRLARLAVSGLAVLTGLIMYTGSALAAVGDITEYALPAQSWGFSIAAGPDGNMWIAEIYSNRVAKVTPAGVVTSYDVPTAGASTTSIAEGSDGNMWITEQNAQKVAKVTPSGVFTEYVTPGGAPYAIAKGPDGNMWFTENGASALASVTPAGVFSEYPIPNATNGLLGLAAGPDGNMWFTDQTNQKVGRMTLAGVVTEYSIPADMLNPQAIAAGPDGNLWFTEYNSNQVDHLGVITPSGVIAAEYTVPTASSYNGLGIAAGPDGNMWITEYVGGKVARVTPQGAFTEFTTPSINRPTGIALGPDGNMWFNDYSANKVSKVEVGSVAAPPLVVSGTTPPSAVEGAPAYSYSADLAHFTGGTAPYAATINWDDVTSTGTVSGPDANGVYTVSGTLPESVGEETPAGSPHNVTVTVTDASSPQQVQSTTDQVAVADAGLRAQPAPAPVAASEGKLQTFSLGSFSDANARATGADFTAVVQWGDGTSSAATIGAPDSSNRFPVSGSHVYAEQQATAYSPTVTVTDDGGSQVAWRAAVNVGDSPIVASGTSLHPVEGVQFRGIVATFTDVGTAGDFSTNINWGDGTSSPGTVSNAGTSFTVAGTHTYTEEGNFPVTVSIDDDGGAHGQASSTAAVADAPISVAINTTPMSVRSASYLVATYRDADPGGTTGDYSGTITVSISGASYSVACPGPNCALSGNSVTLSGFRGKRGTYTVTVTITDSGGATTTASGTVTLTK